MKKSISGVKTSTILIAGAVGVAVLLLVPKIRSHTGFATNVNRGRGRGRDPLWEGGPPSSFPGQGEFPGEWFPGKGNAYAYGRNRPQPPFSLPPPQANRGRGIRF